MQNAHLWPLAADIGAEGHLYIGGCDTVALAREYGTPLYVFDEATLRTACRDFRAALAQHYRGESSVHYASKALLNTAIAQLVTQEGLHLDVVSGGELYIALRAGAAPEHIHLHGNAKPRAELEQALGAGIGRIVVDTLDELDLLAELTANHATPQAVMLRIAPEIAANTHAHIATGHAESKFGLPLAALDAAARRIVAAPGLRLRGLHCHLGSHLFDLPPFAQAIGVLLRCAAQLRDAHGITIDELSPGGGVGVPYTPEQRAPDLSDYAATLAGALYEGCERYGFSLPRLLIEPGRAIVGRAGVALYRVVARKQLPTNDQRPTTNDRAQLGEVSSLVVGPSSYIHIDGGMADNIRPALYGAHYTALLANQANAAATELVHIAGRFCESGDVLIRDVALPASVPGDLVAVAVSGAYTLSMASTYNAVPRPAVVLVDKGRARLIQRRETFEDLVQRDIGL